MLTRENELRLSESVQLRFKAAEASVDSEWMCVAQEIQEQVIKEFSKASHSSLDVVRHMDIALFELRAAANRHPEIALYVRHNRARRGTLRVGDPCPNVSVVSVASSSSSSTSSTPQLQQRNLLDHAKPGRPLVIIAGSYS